MNRPGTLLTATLWDLHTHLSDRSVSGWEHYSGPAAGSPWPFSIPTLPTQDSKHGSGTAVGSQADLGPHGPWAIPAETLARLELQWLRLIKGNHSPSPPQTVKTLKGKHEYLAQNRHL